MDGSKIFEDLLKIPGNNRCADCAKSDPQWAAVPFGIFLCLKCAKLHKDIAPGSSEQNKSKIQPLNSDEWTPEDIKVIGSIGNAKSNAEFEKCVPPCYRRPRPGDPDVVHEQWILAKYDRQEFTGATKPSYLLGQKEGYLWKRGKEDKHFNKRRFVLDSNDNTLRYFNKEGAKEPKATLKINEINALLVPEKVGHPNGMQLMFDQNGDTRSIYLYSDSGKDLIDWYMALRTAKLTFLAIAYPSVAIAELEPMIASEFVKEGWLNKAGPNPGDVFRRRWMTLNNQCLLYYIDSMSAFAKGEIFFDSRDDRYSIYEGIDFQPEPHAFTLRTPGRVFHLSADNEESMHEWVAALKHVIQTAIPSTRRPRNKRKSSLRKTFERLSALPKSADQ